MRDRVAVVTGSNKGIGLAIMRGLCKRFDGDVILTARDEDRGLAALKALEGEGLSPKFHQLDITDSTSIDRLKEFLEITYHGLDVLVNNAAIDPEETSRQIYGFPPDFENPASTEPMPSYVAQTVNVNFTSQHKICEVLFPLLRPHARVCNISSKIATFSFNKCSPNIRNKFTKPDITMEELSLLMQQFVESAQDSKHEEFGFHGNSYGMSKIGFTVLTAIQQREMDSHGAQDIVVNCCSPGFVKTDMTLNKGFLTPDEGAITPLYLCLLPPNITAPRGKMLREMALFDWTTGENIASPLPHVVF